jgi:hypothetical protein
MHGFINGFHPHFPILHPQTLQFREMAVELILAVAAVGSHYCLEAHQGVQLFHIAKSIALEQIRRRDMDNSNMLDGAPYSSSWPLAKPSTSQHGSKPHEFRETPDKKPALHSQEKRCLVQLMQALFFLMAMATWGGENRSLVRQAIMTQSTLAMLVRQDGLRESPATELTWEGWALAESARRTKLIIFSFFNLQTIAFNVPTLLMIPEIQLRLPCSEREWKAPDANSWVAFSERSDTPPLFQDCMGALIRDGGVVPVCSSLGSHVLIHALLQWIIAMQHSIDIQGTGCKMGSRLSLPLRRALKKWQTSWEKNPEASYSPLDKYGPIAFNSTVTEFFSFSICISCAISVSDTATGSLAPRPYPASRRHRAFPVPPRAKPSSHCEAAP